MTVFKHHSGLHNYILCYKKTFNYFVPSRVSLDKYRRILWGWGGGVGINNKLGSQPKFKIMCKKLCLGMGDGRMLQYNKSMSNERKCYFPMIFWFGFLYFLYTKTQTCVLKTLFTYLDFVYNNSPKISSRLIIKLLEIVLTTSHTRGQIRQTAACGNDAP